MKIYLIKNEFTGMTWAHKTLEIAKKRVKNELECLKMLDNETEILNEAKFDNELKVLYIKFRGERGFITISETILFE